MRIFVADMTVKGDYTFRSHDGILIVRGAKDLELNIFCTRALYNIKNQPIIEDEDTDSTPLRDRIFLFRFNSTHQLCDQYLQLYWCEYREAVVLCL